MSRASLLTFLAALAVGLSLGLYIGWVVSPVQWVDNEPASLQQTFKDDYLLMIATAYSQDGNLASAQAELTQLGFADSGAAVAEAALRFVASQKPETEVRQLAHLAAALGTTPPELQPFLP